jgi:nicotinic acid mononucleotide adenylyltransferase
MTERTEPPRAGPPRTPRSPEIRRILGKVRSVFGSLDTYSCLDQRDRREFSYYQDLYEDALLAIDDRILARALEPVDLQDYPQVLAFPRYDIRAALFIGSFDPFQMTHLAAALRYLASPESTAPLVFIIPEGHVNPDKPRRSEYTYRSQMIRWQIEGVFQPLIYPLDIGEGADTIEIVRRFIARFPGARVHITHLVGSDVLPYALKLLPKDMEVWEAEAKYQGVTFRYDIFAIQRGGDEAWRKAAEDAWAKGVTVRYDERSIGTPSSTDFRSNQAFSIVFPTKAVMRHVEVLFRYDLNRPWDPPPTP